MNLRSALLLALLVATGLSPSGRATDLPMNYQAVLQDSAGNPVSGSLSITFKIWDAPAGGKLLWEETQVIEPDPNGQINTLLGEVVPIPDSVFDSVAYLALTIESDDEMVPRTRLSAVGYSYRVNSIDGALGGIISGPMEIVPESTTEPRPLTFHPGTPILEVSDRIRNNPQNGAPGSIHVLDAGGVPVIDIDGGTGSIEALGSSNRIRFDFASLADLPPAGSWDGMFAHVHNTGQAYFAHDGDWVSLLTGSHTHSTLVASDGTPDPAVSVDADGKVGIGTTAPGEELDVVGHIRTQTTGGLELGLLSETVSGGGFIGTYGLNGSGNVKLSNLLGSADRGYVSVHDESGERRAGLCVDDWGAGHITTHSPAGQLINTITANIAGAGCFLVTGPNGNNNIFLSSVNGNADHGYVGVYDGSGSQKAGIGVDESGQGVVFGDVKSFRMVNPENTETEIWYTCPEGPEAAAYIRGTGHLVDGVATVPLPSHFAVTARSEGITVQVTPLSADSKGLAVTEKNTDRLVVHELNGGTGSYDFDYLVMAVRTGFENYKAIRPAMGTLSGERGASASATTTTALSVESVIPPADGPVPAPASSGESDRPENPPEK